MKNALIIFATLIILSPTLYSTSIITKEEDKDIFFKKFKPAYELKEIKPENKTKKQQFYDLFEKISKQ